MADQVVAELSVLISARNDAGKVLQSLDAQLKAANATATTTGRTIGASLSAGTSKAADGALRLAQAQARLASTQGNVAQAEGILKNALDNSTASELKQVQAATQLAQVQNRLSGASQPLTSLFGELTGKVSGLTGALGTLGVAFGVQQLVQFGVEAGKNAIELDKAQRTLRAVTGSTQGYNDALATAKQQQVLFGGSLAENIDGLTGLSITAKQSGADLKQLVDLSQRLGTLDPAQGTAGARIALSEALSGDPTSLAKRYEIPKAALAALRDTSTSAASRLAIIDQYLNKIGITSETASGAISKEAQAYNTLGASIDAVRTKLGAYLAIKAAPIAAGVATTLGAGDQTGQFNTNALKNSQGDFAKYEAQTKAFFAAIDAETAKDPVANWALRQITGLQPLTREQYAYAQSLIKTGTDSQTALTKAQGLANVLGQFGALQQQLNANFDNSTGFAGLADQLTRVAAASPQAQAAVAGLITAYINGKITADQLRVALAGLEQSQIASGNAAAFAAQRDEERGRVASVSAAQVLAKAQADIQAAQAGQLYTDAQGNAIVATQTSADASLIDATAKEQNAAQVALLQEQTQLAAQSFLSLNPGIDGSGVASAVAAGKISTAVGQYIAMTLATARAKAELAALQAQAGLSPQVKAAQAANPFLPLSRPADPGAKADGERAVARVRELNAQEKARTDALRDQVLQTGSATEKQALLNNEYARAARVYGAESAEAIKAKTALDSYTQSQEKAGRKKKAGGTKLSDQQKLNNSLALDQIAADNKLEDEETKHEKKLLDIQEEYAKKRLDADKKLKQSLLDNEGDLYDTLIGLDDQKLAKQVDAQYQAFKANDLPKIAAEKGADVANAYADEYEKTLQARTQRQAEINALRSKTDKDGKKKSSAQAKEDANQAEAKSGVDAIKRQAEDARLQGILDGGNSLKDQEQQALKDENDRYQEANDKIATSSERSAERRVTAAQLAGKKITTALIGEKKSVDDLGASYDRINSKTAASTDAPTTSPDGSGDAQGTKPTATIGDLIGALMDKLEDVKSAIVAAEKDGAIKIASAVKSKPAVV